MRSDLGVVGLAKKLKSGGMNQREEGSEEERRSRDSGPQEGIKASTAGIGEPRRRGRRKREGSRGRERKGLR